MAKRIILAFTLTFLFSCSGDKPADKAQIQTQTIANIPPINTHMDIINTDKFWSLIDNSIMYSQGDNSLKERYLTSELEKLSLDEIRDFEKAFRKCVIEADDFKIMAAQKIIEDYVSDDTYLYFRCWLIGQGKTVYTETVKNPDYLSTIANKGDECDWEGIMYVATNAYSKKTGKKEDETFPRDIAIGLGLDYDFGAPPTKGTDWTEDHLPTLLPKLWAKFN